VLRTRRDGAQPESRTQLLLTRPDLLAAKLLEEARELGAAPTADAARHEAADVLYFTLVAAARHGVTLDEIVAELQRRSLAVTRRPVTAKGGQA
jgi:phosphoribosyl-ATP pyrophosphohydrolase